MCYKNKKLGHVKYDWPLYKAKREKRRFVMATWSPTEDSFKDGKEKEVADMCFMHFNDLAR